jgi:type III secretion system needle length determinant
MTWVKVDSGGGQAATPGAEAGSRIPSGTVETQLQDDFDRLYHRERGNGDSPPSARTDQPGSGERESNSLSSLMSNLLSERIGEHSGAAGAPVATPASQVKDTLRLDSGGGQAAMPEAESARPDQPDRKSGEREDNSLSSLMSGLLGERLGATATPAATQAAVPASPVENAPRMEEMVSRLVEQILVSRPDQAGETEVRLRVQNAVLPDTEIRLVRGTDGLLSVTLSTGRDDAFQTLVSARADLQRALNAGESQEVRVTVMNAGESQAEDGSSGRRSRGYAAWPDDETGERRKPR